MGNKSPWRVPFSDKQKLCLGSLWALPNQQEQEAPRMLIQSPHHNARASWALGSSLTRFPNWSLCPKLEFRKPTDAMYMAVFFN